MRRARATLAIALLFPYLAEGAQGNPLKEGTASISGHVTAADTGKPIRGASVEIVVYENMSARFRQVTTDADGKFEFAKLPAGEYQLASQARRYVAMQYGQLQPGPASLLNPPRRIAIVDGQAYTTANFALASFSAIEGVVVDEFGDPVPNVTVQVSQVLFAGGRRRLMPTNPNPEIGPPTPTDDLGRFRVGGLAPGDYYVEALSGAFADPNAAGGFAITFFPGTSKPASAQAVRVTPGNDVANISFALLPVQMARVAGTIVDGEGRPMAGSTVMLMPSEPSGTVLTLIVRAASGSDGRFTFRNVPPGAYTIQAFGKPIGSGGNLGAAPFGYRTFTVDGRDLDTLTVPVPAPRTLRGKITFDGDLSMLPKTTDVLVSPRQIDFESAPIGGGPSPVTIRDDWTFEVGAMSGLRVVAVSTRSNWILKRATLNGLDVTDTVLDFRDHDVNGLELELTTRVTTLAGTVVGTDGKPISDFSVAVFSEDETKWNLWSRYVTVARPSANGAFTVRGLPAGNYVAVGIPASVGGEWQDPEFLRKLRFNSDAARFSLGDGATATVKVTVKR
jgi:Carboxypeptidase regulatory-like domain